MLDLRQARPATGRLSHRVSCRLLMVICCAGLSAHAAADDIYKWKDRDGVHFGSRPPSTAAEIVKLSSGSGRPPPTSDQLERKERTQRMLDAYADERREQSEARQKKDAERKERQRHCQESKSRQIAYSSAAFLYVTDRDGNRRIVADAERTKMQAEADTAVAKWCR